MINLELPELPYSKDALAPYMSAETLELHHDKHHMAYVTNGNKFIKENNLNEESIEDVVKKSYNSIAPVFNNVSQHLNHMHFWEVIKNNPNGKIPSELENKINDDLGSVDSMKELFINAGIGQFGSGWCWLVLKNGRLKIVTTPNQDNPLMDNLGEPLLGLDVWEHAYYLNYMSDRKKYINNFWKVVNLNKVSQKYEELN